MKKALKILKTVYCSKYISYLELLLMVEIFSDLPFTNNKSNGKTNKKFECVSVYVQIETKHISYICFFSSLQIHMHK